MPQINKDKLDLYLGSIAMSRVGIVGLVMGVEGKQLAIDGELTHVDDLRLVPVASSEESIRDLAKELGITDSDSLAAMVECVRLLEEKQALKLLVPEAKKFVAPVPPSPTPLPQSVGEGESVTIDSPFADDDEDESAFDYDVRKMDLEGKRVRLSSGAVGTVNDESRDGKSIYFVEDGTKVPVQVPRGEVLSVITGEEAAVLPAASSVNPQTIIDSLRTEIRLLERENDKLKAGNPVSEDIEALKKQLAIEKAGREKAEYALVATDLELRTLRNSSATAVPVGGSAKKPIEVKILLDTKANDFERLWGDEWECWQAEFSASDKCRTVWRKTNDSPRPDGSPLREQVALPTLFQQASMEEDYRFENDDTVNVWEEAEKVFTQNEAETVFIQNEAVSTHVIEIPATDLFPRFDKPTIALGPIGTAIQKHGVDAVNAAFDEMERRAYTEAFAQGNALADRPIHQFGSLEKV